MFAVGDTVYLRYKARKGKLESITIKCIKPTSQGKLYIDTRNALFNEDELCDEYEADELVECYRIYWEYLGDHFPVMPPLPVQPWAVNFKYPVGSTVWATTRTGRKEAVVIKEIIYNQYHEGIPQPYRPLYMDTMNWLWNEDELTDVPPSA